MKVKEIKSMSLIIKYLNDKKDTPKYSFICCQRLWFRHQLTHITTAIKKVMALIIPIDKTFQFDNVLICKSCK
jgi:hypothetical protein